MSFTDKFKKTVPGKKAKTNEAVAQCFMDYLRKINVSFNTQTFSEGTRVIVPFETSGIVCEFTGPEGRNISMSLPYSKIPRERIFDVYAFCGEYNEGPHISRCNVKDFNGEKVFCIERNECVGASVTPDEAASKAFLNLEMMKNDVRDIKMQFYRILLR